MIICCKLNRLIAERLQLLAIADVLEVLLVVFLLVHFQEVSVAAVSRTSLGFLEFMRHFW